MQQKNKSPEREEIKAARKALRLTQQKAADIVHVDRGTWNRWEMGEREMHPAFWELFCLKTKGKADKA